jgi:hypothetical protein
MLSGAGLSASGIPQAQRALVFLKMAGANVSFWHVWSVTL